MKYQYTIRKGDAITTAAGVGIITKKTKNYYYYFFNGHISRIKKSSLWRHLDQRTDVGLKYGGMKYRRKQKKDRTLHLHMGRHNKVEEKVRSFLNFVELPCTIITGKSEKMQHIVKQIVSEYGWYISPLSTEYDGSYIIMESWEN